MAHHHIPHLLISLSPYRFQFEAGAPHPTVYNSSEMNGSLLELFQEVLVKPVVEVIYNFYLAVTLINFVNLFFSHLQSSVQQPGSVVAAPVVVQAWPTVLPNHQQRSAVADATAVQLQTMQQSMNQLIQLVTSQQAEQQQMRQEIVQLRAELGQRSAESSRAQTQVSDSLIPKLESVLGVHFERQQKKLDEINNPAKTQQVFHLIFKSGIEFNYCFFYCERLLASCRTPSARNWRIRRTHWSNAVWTLSARNCSL